MFKARIQIPGVDYPAYYVSVIMLSSHKLCHVVQKEDKLMKKLCGLDWYEVRTVCLAKLAQLILLAWACSL